MGQRKTLWYGKVISNPDCQGVDGLSPLDPTNTPTVVSLQRSRY